ncbi:MAG: LTA synthase family protein, partial [Anaerovibrio sp.]|nr:LTA synthase family protein [Anaerovibrio sp.]
MTNSNTNQFKDWNNYYNLIIKGLKVFLFYLSVLSLCRVIFIAILQDYMGTDAGSADIWLALFGGTRLSIQTAGLMTMVVGLPSAVAAVFSRKGGKIIFKVLSAATAAVTMILFFAS